MNARICDKCGRIFPMDSKEVHAICVDRYMTLLEPIAEANYHLCGGCLDALKDWMTQEDGGFCVCES